MRCWLAAGIIGIWSLALAAPAMAQAIDFKFGGWFRYRGIAANNADRLDSAPGGLFRDDDRFFDSVFRPSFTATLEDKARVFFQLDIPFFDQIGGADTVITDPGGNANSLGEQTRRTEVSVVTYNLQVKAPDFIPGNWFVRAGRDNVFTPRGFIGNLPLLREFGIQFWGNIGPYLKPRVELWKRNENDLQDADDDNVYAIKLPVTPMKGVRVMPYLYFWKQARDATTAATVTSYYPAVEASARWRNYFGKVDFVYQTGNIDFAKAGENAGSVDENISAWALWLTGGATFGPVRVSVNYLEVTGDTDQNDRDANQFFSIGCTTSDSAGAGCDAYFNGPTDMWFGAHYEDNFIVGSRNPGGNTGGVGGRYSRGNGTRVASVDASYNVLKNVVLQGTAAAIWSRDARPDLSATGANPFTDDTYVGTEVNLHATWTLYKGVTLSGAFDYLFAGGYGELRNKVSESAQVAGLTSAEGTRLVNENDDAWQAIWKLQWFF